MQRKQWRPTATQLAYLRHAVERGRLRQQAGFRSTLTVRILEEQGLMIVRSWPRRDGADYWEAQVTAKGRTKLAELDGEAT